MSLLEFRRITRENGLLLSEQQYDRLGEYVQMLLDWNRKINLISRRDQENVWFAQILHSVSPWFFVDIAPELKVLDLGTGGGLPGIPLAILRPDLRVTLLDSVRKKMDAVRQMLEPLGLFNVEAVVGRAEEVGRQEGYRHSYDVVVARAVAKLSDLARWSRALLKQGPETGQPSTEVPVGHGWVAPAGAVPERKSLVRIRIDGPRLLTLKGGDLEGELREAAARLAQVRVVPLVFPGGEQIGLEEKKLIIAAIR